ncbi:MAG: hypothetical protein ACLQAS_01125 [Thermoplasmata archaeon]
MPQQRIWDDPTRPKLADFPEEVREQILHRLARMAARCIRKRTEKTGTDSPTMEGEHERPR